VQWIPIIIISTPKVFLITYLTTKIPTIIKIQINFPTNVVDNEWAEFKQFKEKEFERLDKEANQLIKERTQAKKMKMYLKLSFKESLDGR